MPAQVTTETKLALEGFLPVWAIALLGAGLLVLSFWMARRDAKFADKPRLVWFLLLLRCAAVLVLLWMLLGPTLVSVTRTLKTKSVALFVDTSASMSLVDTIDGSGNVSRWAAARENSPQARQLRAVDEAVGTLRAATLRLERFDQLGSGTKQLEAARRLLFDAVQGIDAGLKQIEMARSSLATFPDVQRGMKEATKKLDDRWLDELREKEAEFKRGKTLGALERERWLPKHLAELSAAVGQLDRWADQYVTALEAPLAKSPGAAAVEESKVSRLDKVSAVLADAEQGWLKDIRKRATVTRYEFGDKVIPLGTGPAQAEKKDAKPKVFSPTTQLGAALQQVALDSGSQALEAVILVTDGGHNAGRDPRELAASLSGTTLHIVPIGNTKMQRDVILHHTHAPKAVLQNDNVVIDSLVTAYDCENEKLQVELLANDAVVDRQVINVASEVFDSRVQLRWKAASLGKQTLSLRVVPVSDERTEENNSAKADIHVMEDKIRVLVADNFPRWETRYLLNLFRRDDRIAFEQLLFEPHPATGESARRAFPASPEEWRQYRVVILGDLLPSQLTPQVQESLRQYVGEMGGNLVVVSGKEAMPRAFMNQPLAALLPVQVGDRALPANNPFYLHVTDEGSMTIATQIADDPGASERVWREMSERLPIYSLSEFSRPKATAHSLIWASLDKQSFNPADPWTRSFLAWQYVGAGRVVYLAAPVTYQLRYRQGDAFHHRFWGQLLRWAVARDLAEGSTTVRLSTDKSRYEQGDAVQVSVRLNRLDGKTVTGATCDLKAVQENKLVQAITLKEDAARPGSYHGIIEQLPVGPVQLEVSGDRVTELLAAEKYRRPIETTIHIDPSGVLELRHPLCNLPLLRQVAEASGGMVVPPTGLPGALARLNLDPEVLENIAKRPLWNRWDLFWIFIACLSLEWAGRKYIGLS